MLKAGYVRHPEHKGYIKPIMLNGKWCGRWHAYCDSNTITIHLDSVGRGEQKYHVSVTKPRDETAEEKRLENLLTTIKGLKKARTKQRFNHYAPNTLDLQRQQKKEQAWLFRLKQWTRRIVKW